MQIRESEIYALLKHHVDNLFYQETDFFDRIIEIATQGKILALQREKDAALAKLKEKK